MAKVNEALALYRAHCRRERIAIIAGCVVFVIGLVVVFLPW